MTKSKTTRWNPTPLTTCVALLFLFAFATQNSALAAIGSDTRIPVTATRALILVQPKNRIAEDQLQNVFASLDAKQVDIIQQINVRILSVPEQARDRILDSLSHRADIEFAEPDAILAPDFAPNDPSYKNEWHLSKIQVPSAWDITPGSSTVIVAICDTGVDSTHPDLAANIVPGWNFYDNNSDTSDVHGHGTAVAGTAAAVGNNSLGVAGVAMNCRIMPLRISSPEGFGSSGAMGRALTYAADHGARVANISYRASTSSTVSSAAHYLNSKGGVVTISSGNETTFDPSSDNPYVITVGATDSSDNLASWSNTGNNLDIVAPGVSIFTTTRGGGYGSWSGTSFSAPCVAGVAALMFSINPSLGAVEVMNLLKQTADDLGSAGWDTTFGSGRVNASKAVLAAASGSTIDVTSPTAGIISPASGATVEGVAQVNVAASDNVGITQVALYLDGVLTGTATDANPSFTWDTTAVADGTHTLQAAAQDAAGNTCTSSATAVTVKNTPDTTPPTVWIVSPASGTAVGRNLKVTVNSADDIGVMSLSLYLDGNLASSSSAGGATFSMNTTKWSKGLHRLLAIAYDGAGNQGVSISVTVSK